MIKDPQWYYVQEGDATMMTIASLPGQKKYYSRFYPLYSVISGLIYFIGNPVG